MSHTPGPWFVDDEVAPSAAGVFLRLHRARGTLGIPISADACTPDREIDEAEKRANAHLIAAAPELLAALKAVLAGFEAKAFQRNIDGDHEPGWAIRFFPHLKALADATVAIEKAEGVKV